MNNMYGFFFRPAKVGDMSKEYDMYTEMLSLLDKYEKDVYSQWCNGLEQVCLINLKQPLLTRNISSGLISVNFNPKVIDTLFRQSDFTHC